MDYPLSAEAGTPKHIGLKIEVLEKRFELLACSLLQGFNIKSEIIGSMGKMPQAMYERNLLAFEYD